MQVTEIERRKAIERVAQERLAKAMAEATATASASVERAERAAALAIGQRDAARAAKTAILEAAQMSGFLQPATAGSTTNEKDAATAAADKVSEDKAATSHG